MRKPFSFQLYFDMWKQCTHREQGLICKEGAEEVWVQLWQNTWCRPWWSGWRYQMSIHYFRLRFFIDYFCVNGHTESNKLPVHEGVKFLLSASICLSLVFDEHFPYSNNGFLCYWRFFLPPEYSRTMWTTIIQFRCHFFYALDYA